MTAVTLNIEPLDATFGAWVHDIELRSIDEATFAALHETWLEYALLIFSDQFLTNDEQDAFAQRFGNLEFNAAPISNVGKDGKVHHESSDDLVKSLKGNWGWHHDSTYMPLQAKGAVFTAELVPKDGADTGWADMRAAYEVLSDEDRELVHTLEAHHSLYYSQGRAGLLPKKKDDGTYGMYGYHDMDISVRPMVKYHPDTGRPNLLIGRHAHDIIGMDPDESVALLDRLNQEACQPPRTYQHAWTAGEAVIWDNRRLMHQGVPFDMSQPRKMWHSRIAGEIESELALNHTAETAGFKHGRDAIMNSVS
ncbi:MAG: TauD/TfdA family dioxygenase [Acidimicrobiales bacterium]|nr:TauD/TfdA family dioxygenase [Acidimicrobiaceae bacterium]MYA27699.1 TauD/TfdA family dioxygenase [Acidimicrobiales bacterium]MYD82139.1 TauD/TfdA family dioxygenase [Acidimicrobiales bacterium]MYJ64128.1 TauD/TfdA family dioxygenase [Acidimicrobiales bacterium]